MERGTVGTRFPCHLGALGVDLSRLQHGGTLPEAPHFRPMLHRDVLLLLRSAFSYAVSSAVDVVLNVLPNQLPVGMGAIVCRMVLHIVFVSFSRAVFGCNTARWGALCISIGEEESREKQAKNTSVEGGMFACGNG